MTPATPEERDRLTTIETNYKHIKENIGHIRSNTDKIFAKLDEQGDVKEALKEHKDGHKFFFGAIISIVALVCTILGLILHYK